MIKHLYFSEGALKTVFFIVTNVVAILSIALIVFIRSRAIFSTIFVVVLLGYAISLSYTLFNGVGFGAQDYLIAANLGIEYAGDAWATFKNYIFKALGLSALVGSIFLLGRFFVSKNNLFVNTYYIFAVLILGISLSYFVSVRTTGYLNFYIAPVKVINRVVYGYRNKVYYGKRELLTKLPTLVNKYDNIILIVDESISGNYLSINGYDKETTPFLKSVQNKFVNFGSITSGANCSAESNIILMSGIEQNQLPDRSYRTLKKPSIFQYAKNAGYRTSYISGQSYGDKLQNYITKFDKEYIDHFYQPPKDRSFDSIIPEENITLELEKALDKKGKNFIFMVKLGAHFPWESRYPESRKVFEPTLKKDEGLSSDTKEKALNSYRNAIRYMVDSFFENLFLKTGIMNKESTLVIYTSDHGQSILVPGESNATHCDSESPYHDQGNIPLLVFETGSKIFSQDTVNKRKYSHYDIFPTITLLMGFEHNKSTLLSGNKDEGKPAFFSGDMFGRSRYSKTSLP